MMASAHIKSLMLIQMFLLSHALAQHPNEPGLITIDFDQNVKGAVRVILSENIRFSELVEVVDGLSDCGYSKTKMTFLPDILAADFLKQEDQIEQLVLRCYDKGITLSVIGSPKTDVISKLTSRLKHLRDDDSVWLSSHKISAGRFSSGATHKLELYAKSVVEDGHLATDGQAWQQAEASIVELKVKQNVEPLLQIQLFNDQEDSISNLDEIKREIKAALADVDAYIIYIDEHKSYQSQNWEDYILKGENRPWFDVDFSQPNSLP